MNKLENGTARVAVVTGASSGIGRAAAKEFARQGYRVYGISRHDAGDPEVRWIRGDVTSPEDMEAAMRAVVGETGRIDVLVTCAGMGVSGPVEFIPEQDMRTQFEVNLYGTIHAVRAALPQMREQRSGRIICVSSVAAVFSIPFQAYYSASKSAINALTDALRNELKPFGISVCSVMPGDIRTGFTDARKKTVVGSDVYVHAASSVASMEKDERNGLAPETVGNLLVRLAGRRRVAPLYTSGFGYKCLVFLNRLLPRSLIVKLVGVLYK